jgi:hypothetical protein
MLVAGRFQAAAQDPARSPSVASVNHDDFRHDDFRLPVRKMRASTREKLVMADARKDCGEVASGVR